MVMSLEFLIEETVTQGLTELQERVSDEMEFILNEMAYAATGYEDNESAPIPSRMSTSFNPFLFYSGQMEENRQVEISQDESEIRVKYSGMLLEEVFGSEAKVWSEFGDPVEGILERDYAFYQETGQDPIARPAGAKHKYAIQRGLWAAHKQIRETAGRNWKLMLERI